MAQDEDMRFTSELEGENGKGVKFNRRGNSSSAVDMQSGPSQRVECSKYVDGQ